MSHLSGFVILSALFFAGLSSEALCVSASKANLRNRPSTKGAITLSVGKYTPLLELERKGGWYKVKDVDGVVHWIYSSLVTSRFQCMIVKSSRANIRTGPGGKFPLARYPIANRYFAFRKLDSEEAWLKIQSPSGRGPFWIHENLVWQAFRVQSIGF